MNNEIIDKILDDNYDIAKEESLKNMIGEFYTRKRISTIILVWTYGTAMMLLAIWSAISFYKTDIIKDMIMYAALSLLFIQQLALIKIFAWQVIHRSSIKKDLKKIEFMLVKLQNSNPDISQDYPS